MSEVKGLYESEIEVKLFIKDIDRAIMFQKNHPKCTLFMQITDTRQELIANLFPNKKTGDCIREPIKKIEILGRQGEFNFTF